MAPEAPGNLIVIDLRFQDGELKGSAERVEYDPEYTARIEETGAWFYVLWNETPKGEDYFPVGGGVVFVKKDLPLGYRILPKSPIELDSLGNGRFAYRYPALGEGLMLVLILPEGYTLADSRPMPRSAKVFKKKRLAVYWKPEGKYGANVKVAWEIMSFAGDLRAERDRMNADIDKSENVSDNAGVRIDVPAHQGEDKEQEMKDSDRTRVLIIHGHDERNLLALKDLLQSKLRLPEPVIMAQQIVPGASLPEKFERLAASVEFAVALLTPDDVGRASADADLRPRPRQNTLVEIGWFWGRLGRDRVLLLVKEELELPSDLQGVEFYRFGSRVEEVSEKVRDFFEAHQRVEDAT